VAKRAIVPAEGEELVFPGDGMCFGCSPRNAAGLKLRFFRDGDGTRCETTVAAAYQGAPEIVHGGIQAVLLDETCCAAAFFSRGGYVVTGQLNVKYRRPCHVGRPLTVRARIVAEEARFLRIVAEIHERGSDDAVTTAEGKFYPNPARA
jgi:acyl-coenzyme A thioesterase PaaI-like protein